MCEPEKKSKVSDNYDHSHLDFYCNLAVLLMEVNDTLRKAVSLENCAISVRLKGELSVTLLSGVKG